MTDRSKLLALAEAVEKRISVCAENALSCRVGGTASPEWIAEAANYATVAAALRAQAEEK